jgi:hypothetical protein
VEENVAGSCVSVDDGRVRVVEDLTEVVVSITLLLPPHLSISKDCDFSSSNSTYSWPCITTDYRF